MDSSEPDYHPPLIRASELGQYSFCRRAWWLGTVKKLTSENQAHLSRGQKMHDRHGQKVRVSLYWRQAGLFLVASGGFFLIVALLWLWVG